MLSRLITYRDSCKHKKAASASVLFLGYKVDLSKEMQSKSTDDFTNWDS
ncbi:hypothetical protein SBF1_3860001 [Candidatus Desulfosporosinus infrequens]|uniref:Uncharacterized protein n=1 Tax=Candidatus Desulfosporosinus infrequens TaxID=2043169 RepID=A0A2U3L645_9FIRM|nr:hypothetical protein SBF1_3860001 [Candidatus Desulfosporosinus infrequens]